jgi:hypothetical protein
MNNVIMLDPLRVVSDAGSNLLSVEYALFGGDPAFVTAVSLGFGDLIVTFRAVADDDTMAIALGSHQPLNGELVRTVGDAVPWCECIGSHLSWGWVMTNHQGYTDGVRLEFGSPARSNWSIVELVVEASAIRVFTARESTPPGVMPPGAPRG